MDEQRDPEPNPEPTTERTAEPSTTGVDPAVSSQTFTFDGGVEAVPPPRLDASAAHGSATYPPAAQVPAARAPAPQAPAENRPLRRARGVAALVGVSLLSAVLASTGTAAVLVSAFPAAPAATSPTTGQAVNTGSSSSAVDDITGVVAAARESVVTITADGLSSSRFSPFQVPTTGVGSGVILTADGYILTNRHVVSGSQSLTVAFADGSELPARIVKIAADTDLALIKVNVKGLHAATIGDAGSVQVGQTAIAIGSPLGSYTETVTRGIVSGLDREITVADEATRQQTTLKGLIQTDAAINPGNSGGPLLDVAGQVIGLNTAIASDAEGLGFAIPISAAAELISLASSGASA